MSCDDDTGSIPQAILIEYLKIEPDPPTDEDLPTCQPDDLPTRQPNITPRSHMPLPHTNTQVRKQSLISLSTNIYKQASKHLQEQESNTHPELKSHLQAIVNTLHQCTPLHNGRIHARYGNITTDSSYD